MTAQSPFHQCPCKNKRKAAYSSDMKCKVNEVQELQLTSAMEDMQDFKKLWFCMLRKGLT